MPFATGGPNLLLLMFAGSHVTGVWALAQRLLVAPVVLFQTVGRVGFVVFSRVVTREEDERQAQRVLGITALAAAALLATVVGRAPALVGGVLGHEWDGVVVPVTLAAAGWMMLGPLWVALWGLVQARGDLRGPLLGGAVQLGVLWTAAIALAPRFGAEAIGAAFLCALLATGTVLYVNSRRIVTLRLMTLALAGTIAAVAAAVAGPSPSRCRRRRVCRSRPGRRSRSGRYSQSCSCRATCTAGKRGGGREEASVARLRAAVNEASSRRRRMAGSCRRRSRAASHISSGAGCREPSRWRSLRVSSAWRPIRCCATNRPVL